MTQDRPLSLEASLRLAGDHLLACLDPTRDHLPYWNMAIDADLRAGFRHWWHGHNFGRLFDALLRLEAATTWRFPRVAEAALRRHLQRYFDNEDHLCLEPITAANRAGYAIDLHSLREGLLALHALVRWRGDRWARGKGEAMVASLDRLIADPARWDLSRFRLGRRAMLTPGWGADPTSSHGRLIEALVWFHEASGHVPALALAGRLVEYHAPTCVNDDGRYNPACRATHSHSYLGTLRGICLYGLAVDRHDLVERVARALRVFVPTIVKPSGFTAHDLFRDRGGETTSPGDAAQLALWLARAGYGEFWDAAQRIVRARLLPSQIASPLGLTPAGDESLDAFRNVDARAVGAFGGMHSEPHGGFQPTTDVTAAGLHTMIDVHRHAVETTPRGTRVNLQFNADAPLARVRVEDAGERRVTVKSRRGTGPLWLRVPRWADAASVRVTINGRDARPARCGDYAVIGEPPASATVVLSHDLPAVHRIEPTDGVEHALTWRGDRVVSVDPDPARTSFYRPWAHARLNAAQCSTLQRHRPIRRASPPSGDAAFTPVSAIDAVSRFINVREFHRGEHGLLFIRAAFHAPRAGRGTLRLGADGPIRAWVNGRLAGTFPGACNPARTEQFICPARWRRGDNTIALALDTNHGKAWGVFIAPTLD